VVNVLFSLITVSPSANRAELKPILVRNIIWRKKNFSRSQAPQVDPSKVSEDPVKRALFSCAFRLHFPCLGSGKRIIAIYSFDSFMHANSVFYILQGRQVAAFMAILLALFSPFLLCEDYHGTKLTTDSIRRLTELKIQTDRSRHYVLWSQQCSGSHILSI